MKILSTIKFFAAFVMALSTSALFGQITIDNSTFPQAGDTLFTILAAQPNISIGDDGANVEWDFRSLSGPFAIETRFLDASEGTAPEEFPDADLVSISANQQEIYYQSFNNKIIEIGRAGEFVEGFDIPVAYEETPTYRKAPISFGDVDDDEAIANVELGAEIIPEELLEGIPLEFDSIRISLVSQSESIVDAWGTVRMPDADYEVLRDKVSNTTNTLIFAKVPILGWFDVSGLAEGAGLGDVFGEVSTTTYNYYSATDKEIIASVTVDDQDNITTVEFKGNMIVSNIKSLAPDANLITAFPNPSFGNVSIQMVNYPLGEYRMKVYNVVGKELWSEAFQLKSNRVYKADLLHLSKGTYLYSIFDSNGKKLVTKRLAIMSI